MRLIDADALIKEYDKQHEGVPGRARKLMEDAPTVMPEQNRGKWLECDVFDEHNITEWQSAKCSVCGHYHTTPYLYSFSYYNFCPTCGADMRKRNE